MEVKFDPSDLRPECEELPASQVRFEHLNELAQGVLFLAGRATFWRSGFYNAVYPPLKEKECCDVD